MAKNSMKPQIRFKGFTDAWEQRKFGEYFEERNERSGEGELISVTINSGIKKFNELGRFDTKPEDLSKYKRVDVGDIAYNSMRMWQGASGYSPYSGILSPAYTVISPRTGVSSMFFAYLIKRPQMIHLFEINSQGLTSDTWNLKFPAFSQIEASAPTDIAEQKNIAEIFTVLDNLITLHQRKYEKFVNIKKALLEKMFPQGDEKVPRIRFKGFTDAWEQRKLGDIGRVAMNRRIFKEQTSDEGSVPFYKIGTFGGEPDAFISDELYQEYKALFPYPKIGDILLSASGSIGKMVEYKGEKAYFQDSNIVWLDHDASVSNSFLKCFYSVVKWAGLEGSTIKRLYNKNILETKIALPSYAEQVLIGDFFEGIDNLITLHQRQVEKLKNIKSALLEKMFV